MRKPTIAGVINARLLSSRLPRKLLLPFGGTTLIDIALEKLASAEGFVHRYFAVAEDELADRLTDHHGITLLRRDPAAVQPGYNAHEKIFEHYRLVEADYIFWLNPCAPLLTGETIRRTCDLVQATQHNSYTSVVETRDWIFDEAGLPVTNRQAGMLSTAHSARTRTPRSNSRWPRPPTCRRERQEGHNDD
jgi:CMP-2-keto-3-deoxyoctulosonic acid synthetase